VPDKLQQLPAVEARWACCWLLAALSCLLLPLGALLVLNFGANISSLVPAGRRDVQADAGSACVGAGVKSR
jgi:hypothetical protein